MALVTTVLIVGLVVGLFLQPHTLYRAGTVILLGPQECKSNGFSLTISSKLVGAFTASNGSSIYIEMVSQNSPTSAGTTIYSTGRVSSANINVDLPANGAAYYYLELCNHGSDEPTNVTITSSIVLTPHF